MESVLKCVVILGKSTLCLPWNCHGGSDHGALKLKCPRAIKVLQIFAACPVTAMFLDTVLTNTAETFAGTSKFSEHIALYITYFASVSPDLVIRTASIAYNQEQQSLIQNMLPWIPNWAKKVNRLKNMFILLSFLFSILIWTLGSLSSMITTDINYELPPAFRLTILGSNEFIFRSAYIITDLWSVLAVAYAWLFSGVVGILLVERLHIFTLKCEELVRWMEKTKILENPCVYHTELPAITQEFLFIKVSLENYGKIGGSYLLAVMLNCTLHIITYLSTKCGQEETSSNYQHSIFYTIQAASLLPAIILISSFGNYLTKEVCYYPAFVVKYSTY